MPIEAVELIRRMRGGAQAHLLRASDGRFYVVKFLQNPQHPRILVNEFAAGCFLEYLQISAPRPAVIQITPDFLARYPELGMELGGSRAPVEPGPHFGSPFPGDPATLAVYDFIPDKLLDEVVNGSDFLAMLAFDKWMANADGRQAVFFRGPVRTWAPRQGGSTRRIGLVVTMIDHGFVFNGPYWDFPDSPLMGLYPRRVVYEQVRSLDDFQPALDQIMNFPEEVVDEVCRQIPRAWLRGDEEGFERLIGKLLLRRKRLADLIEGCRDQVPDLFPNWQIRMFSAGTTPG